MSAQVDNNYSFDLAEEMVDALEKEFGPEALKGEMAKALDGEPDEATARKFFEDFGTRWMERSIELGEAHPDRTYEVLLEAAKKVPEYNFPYIPQRYLEIAYLCTQPIYTVPIVENSKQGIVFKMPFCGYHTAIQEAKGDEFADELHCTACCTAACQKAFTHFGHKVDVGFDQTMTADGVCQIAIRPA